MKIRILFYKAKRGDGHWIDNAIDVWTAIYSSKNRSVGHYAHVEEWEAGVDGKFEIMIPQGNPQFANCPPPIYELAGACWTSTMRGDDNGSVVRNAKDVIKNKDRWDYCEIELGERDSSSMGAYLLNEIDCNKGYSKRDILKFVGLGIFADDKRNICSEIVNNALYYAGVLDKPGVVSPRRLAYLLKQKGYDIKPLSASY